MLGGISCGKIRGQCRTFTRSDLLFPISRSEKLERNLLPGPRLTYFLYSSFNYLKFICNSK
ncbi:Uncharacterized protein dnm_040090 [Desulfonema magnum]|uniref:Uncharacterized protein n=1 Tax=Desulfonema magnum TaxID=45655 RepID=A0A975BMY5_9BACT|nr:Uncharacterized protein dnm_040090 [Desulfonema magnum]